MEEKLNPYSTKVQNSLTENKHDSLTKIKALKVKS